ncbi:3'-5' exoribonuclease [Desulfovibrio litoralis]|uniref:Uncharacterized protein n=1 Tax=Desulfovibrio litoralis DSM 11393 TaxID=1121455 RepID=A0A1M7TL42_9BACT|nr:3'-5' exoribonuclease [Desulfovibrio litoralis]SHN71452.1 protein of unknown function [Desulfovibrio litoralis DSM 11393]
MKEISIFFDTEFSDFENSELISLGAISADGKSEFYAEINNIPENCSEFVKERVLPLLHGNGISKTELAKRFLAWLESFDSNIELCSDSHYDRNMIANLCGGFPLPLSNGAKSSWFPLPHIITDNPHNALEDAKLLRKYFAPHFLLDDD